MKDLLESCYCRKDRSAQKGSVLMLALLFATILAMGIGSYINLANTELRLANTQFYFNAGMNLAEGGAEEALYALNNNAWSTAGWSEGSEPSQKVKKIEGVELGKGGTGEINVRVDHYNTDPVIIVEGKITSFGGRETTKQVEIILTRRTLFANGLTARDRVRFAGNNAEIDSYRSSDDPYDVSSRRYNGKVGSASVEAAPELNNASVFGFVFTGGQQPNVGPNGQIRGENDDDGTVNPERITTDFRSDFPPPPPPDSSASQLGRINSSEQLESGSFSTPEINLDGDSILEIVGDVRLYVARGDSGKGDVNIEGSASIVIREGGSLRLHVDGNVNSDGNGVANETNIPQNLIIFGNNPDTQTFTLEGNAKWHAAVYAPNARVNLAGNADTFGAIIGDEIHVKGGARFHYDEDLADFSEHLGFGMESWRELFEDQVAFN